MSFRARVSVLTVAGLALDGHTATAPSGIEIDHHVALAEAWRSGASGWSNERRRAFANDLDVSYALNGASTAANQSKADKDPARWLPSNHAYRCEYVISWALVKYRWSLSVDPTEDAALRSELSGTCGRTAVSLPEVVAADAPSVPAPATFPDGRTRLGGADRYATALSVSARYAPGVDAVFVATGTAFPDALSAAAAAALAGGPLLLTPGGSLPDSVAAEVCRLAPERIYVIGGTGAVSDAVRSRLTRIAPTERLGGSDCYSTGLAVVRAAFTSSKTAFIATGRSFPDALAASGAAGAAGAPVVLVDGAGPSVSGATLDTLRRLGVTRVVIAGGTGAVSAGIEAHLRTRYSVARLGGADRYATAATINDAHFPAGSTDTVFLATGTSFPDALAGAALAGRLGAPLFVTTPTCVPGPVQHSIAQLAPRASAALGGSAVVSDAAARNTGCTSGGVPPLNRHTCPAWAPIKGNRDSGIYHVPGGRSYAQTVPEECFRTEADAQRAGYRKARA